MSNPSILPRFPIQSIPMTTSAEEAINSGVTYSYNQKSKNEKQSKNISDSLQLTLSQESRVPKQTLLRRATTTFFQKTLSNPKSTVPCRTTSFNPLPQSNLLNSTNSLPSMDNQATLHSKEGSQHNITKNKAPSPEHDTKHDARTHDSLPSLSIPIPSVTSTPPDPDTVNQEHETVESENKVNHKSRLCRILSSLIECVKRLLSSFFFTLKACFGCATPSSCDSNNEEYEEDKKSDEAPSEENNLDNSIAYKNDDTMVKSTTKSYSTVTETMPVDTARESDEASHILKSINQTDFNKAIRTLNSLIECYNKVDKEADSPPTSLLGKVKLALHVKKMLPTTINKMKGILEQLKADTDLVFGSRNANDRNTIAYSMFLTAILSCEFSEEVLVDALDDLIKFMLTKNINASSALDISFGMQYALKDVPSNIKTFAELYFGNIPKLNLKINCTYEAILRALLQRLIPNMRLLESQRSNEAEARAEDPPKTQQAEQMSKARDDLISKFYLLRDTLKDTLYIEEER